MTHVTCRLTAKNRDQLRNPTLGNRAWAAFTFLLWLIEYLSVYVRTSFASFAGESVAAAAEIAVHVIDTHAGVETRAAEAFITLCTHSGNLLVRFPTCAHVKIASQIVSIQHDTIRDAI